MRAEVSQKSYADMPDYEAQVDVGKFCVVPYRDDQDDLIGHPCMGEIEWGKAYGRCTECGASYLRKETDNAR